MLEEVAQKGSSHIPDVTAAKARYRKKAVVLCLMLLPQTQDIVKSSSLIPDATA